MKRLTWPTRPYFSWDISRELIASLGLSWQFSWSNWSHDTLVRMTRLLSYETISLMRVFLSIVSFGHETFHETNFTRPNKVQPPKPRYYCYCCTAANQYLLYHPIQRYSPFYYFRKHKTRPFYMRTYTYNTRGSIRIRINNMRILWIISYYMYTYVSYVYISVMNDFTYYTFIRIISANNAHDDRVAKWSNSNNESINQPMIQENR